MTAIYVIISAKKTNESVQKPCTWGNRYVLIQQWADQFIRFSAASGNDAAGGNTLGEKGTDHSTEQDRSKVS